MPTMQLPHNTMTDQQIRLHFGELNSAEMRLARAIVGWYEGEIEALKAEAAMWKANHDNQVKLKSLLINRPDLGDRAPRIQKLLDENARLIQDWADTDTAVRETCRKAGIDVDGSPAHVPDIPELVERLAKENAKLRAAADAMFAALNDCREDTCELIAERDWWKDEPRCKYDVRYQEMKDRLNAAITALAAYQATKP
jgi:hypothetical protein